MNSRERVAAAFDHREPDRTPLFEYVLLPPVADHILGRKFAAAPENFQALAAEIGWPKAVARMATDYLDIVQRLGFDLLYVPPNPPENLRGPAANEAGDDPAQAIRDRVVWLRAHTQDINEQEFLVYTCLREEMQQRGLDIPILAPAYRHGVWTDTDLMQAMILEPETVREFFRLVTECAFRTVAVYVSLGIDMIGVGGDFAGSRGPMISPACYREFIVPEVRRMSDRIHAAGKKAINASDGNLWPVIEDFLLSCGVDGYIEIESRAGMGLRELKKTYGDRITFLGNLDCSLTLSFGTRAEVKDHVKRCLQDGWGHGGHILCSDNAISASVPVANYLAVVAAYREYFGIREAIIG